MFQYFVRHGLTSSGNVLYRVKSTIQEMPTMWFHGQRDRVNINVDIWHWGIQSVDRVMGVSWFLIHSSYAMLSSGIPWIISRLYTILYHVIESKVARWEGWVWYSWMALIDGKVLWDTDKHTTAFLHSDWLYFLCHGIKASLVVYRKPVTLLT